MSCVPTSCPSGLTIGADGRSCAPATCPTGVAGQSSTQCMQNKTAGGCSAKTPFTYTPNPIHTGNGNKYWSETDYGAASSSGLSFHRQYNSQNTAVKRALGTGWHHNYGSFITTGLSINGTAVVMMARPDGTSYSFVASGNDYVAQDGDVTDQLIRLADAAGTPTGWKYMVADNNATEIYDNAGKLISMTDRQGRQQTLAYSGSGTPTTIAPKAGLLIRVTDHYGRQLNFTYDSASRISKLTDPANGEYRYQYDGSNNLVAVTYPDTKVKRYHYNEPAYTGNSNLPNALTGISDENGVRYATYYYDAQGKAISSEHAGGVNRYQLSFGANSSTITDPLGTARTTSFTTVLGVIKVTGQSQPGGSGCGPASSAIGYDANGNVATRTDFNGVQTTYAYDLARNLETRRTEAAGMPEARTISTEWHPTYRLPTKIAEPKRVTANTYDDKGNLLSKAVQATADESGSQGFAAEGIGTPRTWRYTYNPYGQVLTATGPRTDVSDVTSYAYDAQGNLSTITNAGGQVTTLSQYDAHGRAGRIVDPNGLVTELAYSPRGWLTAKTVGGEVTSYEYDGVGQLKKATQPDGSYVDYTYDDAHRLTAIADSLGNRIGYTLDAMGNRVKEAVQDPDGVLNRQTTRVYDALNRLQQVTGGGQ